MKKEMTGFHDRIAAWYPEIAASADYRIFYFFVLHMPRGIVRMIYTSYSRSVVLKSLVGFVIRMVKRRK